VNPWSSYGDRFHALAFQRSFGADFASRDAGDAPMAVREGRWEEGHSPARVVRGRWSERQVTSTV